MLAPKYLRRREGGLRGIVRSITRPEISTYQHTPNISFRTIFFISLPHCHAGHVHSMSSIGAHRSQRARFRLRSRGCAQMRTGGPRRAAQLARGCVCPPVARRRRPRAGAALFSRAAAAARLLPPAVAPALASRSLLPRLRLPALCSPPSAQHRRRAALARGCRCPPVAPRRCPRADAALPSPAAAAARLLPPAVAPALAPRFLRPRVLRCRGPGFSNAADQAGRMGEGEASVGGDGLVLDSATRVELGWWRGGSTRRRRRTTACGSPLVACRRRRSTVCTEKSISIGKKKTRRGIKKRPFVVIEQLLHVTKHKAIHSRYATQCPWWWWSSCQTRYFGQGRGLYPAAC